MAAFSLKIAPKHDTKICYPSIAAVTAEMGGFSFKEAPCRESGFLGVVVLIALAAGGGFYFYRQQMQKKKAEKEALDPDANYTEDKGDFEIPTDVPDEDEAPDEQDTDPI